MIDPSLQQGGEPMIYTYLGGDGTVVVEIRRAN
jgi:hypothetical protein